MDIDELLEQVRQTQFPSTWEGCLLWSSGLVSWHLAQRPSTWTPLQQVPDQAQLYIQHVGAVVACALHAIAVEQQLDAPDGADLLRVPLAPAAALLGDCPLDILAAAAPSHRGLRSLLHSIPVWIDAGDEETRLKGKFILEQAQDVLATHTEFGYAVGDRLRAALESNQALDEIQQGTAPVGYPPGSDTEVYERGQSMDEHMQALANVEAMLRADKKSGASNPILTRRYLLLRAAIADRMTLGLGPRATEDSLARAGEFAQALLDHDREHQTQTGSVPADDPQWAGNVLGYVRQEYDVHVEQFSRPLLDD